MVLSRVKVYLDVFDPDQVSPSHVNKLLGISADDATVAATPSYEAQHHARFDFRHDDWPTQALGDTQAATEFRDHWKHPVFFHAATWLMSKSPSAFAPLLEDNGEVYFVIGGYEGILPRDLLQQILRLGLQFEIQDDASQGQLASPRREGTHSAHHR
jgi:hypothetical protein